jgi:hypothetical protein
MFAFKRQHRSCKKALSSIKPFEVSFQIEITICTFKIHLISMKQTLLILTTLLLFTGCKKLIQKTQEQIAEDLIVKAMTDGQWQVIGYNDGAEFMSEFTDYRFQFKSNRTVDAVKNAAVESTGSWQGDGYKQEITADYPSTSNTTLQRLDGVWKIVASTWTSVKATQTINGKLTTLELKKF